ncbi:DUF3298 domain-containing protein [Acetobacterium wieringae]|uniref:DUF3298 domain-containing protein n=1 Tax=Acetobacterium wieringae TaxID=52694 RepID=UPI0031584D5B
MTYNDEKTEELIVDDAILTKPHHNKKLFLIIGGGVLLLVLLVIALFLPGYLRNNHLNKSLELGEHYLEEGNYEEAILAYTEVLEIDTKNIIAYEAIATSYIELEDYDQAEKVLETAKSINETGNNKVLMSQVLVNTDREDEAQELLDTTYDNPPKNAKLAISLLDDYLKKREYDKIITLLEKAIDGNESRKDLILLYDELYYYALMDKRSDEEIQALVDKAFKATGDPRFTVLIKTDFKEAKTDTATGIQLSDVYYKIPVFNSETTAGKAIGATYLKMESEWKTNSISSMAEYLDDPVRRAGSSTMAYVNEDKVDMYISYYDNNLITITQNRFTYYGGPHGYNEKISHTFNLTTGQEINTKDFFSISDETLLRAKLTDEFSKKFNSTTTQNGSTSRYSDVDLKDVNEKVLTDAVYTLTDDGLSVLFNQYDVASYATGQVEIIIPFSRTDLLKPIETLTDNIS